MPVYCASTGYTPLSVLPRRLQLYDHANAPIRWCDEAEARQLVKEGYAELVWGTKRVHGIRLTAPGTDTPARVGGGKHYSHCCATDRNPRGVWTLVPVTKGDRPFHELYKVAA